MTENFLNEALTIRDEYFHSESNYKNEWYWEKLIQLAKDGDLQAYIDFCALPDPQNIDLFVDESVSYFVWMYQRGPFRNEANGVDKEEPYEDILNMNCFKFANLLNEAYDKIENQLS